MVLKFYLNKTVMKPTNHSPLHVPLDSDLTRLSFCYLTLNKKKSQSPKCCFQVRPLQQQPSLPHHPPKWWKCQPEPLWHRGAPTSQAATLSTRNCLGAQLHSGLLSPPTLCCLCVQQATQGNSESSSFQFGGFLEGLAQTQHNVPRRVSVVGIWAFVGKPFRFSVHLDIFRIKCWKN